MKKQLLTLFIIISFSAAFGQVGVNTTAPNAQLDVRSSNQAAPANTDGILIPKIDVFPVTNPTSAQNGMMVFLTTAVGIKLPGFYYWDSTTSTWIGLGVSANYWSLAGNSGTTAGTNFIGTTDNQAIDFRTNNILKTRFTTKGQIETLNTGNSVFIGEGSGANDDLTDNRNTLIGLNAGQTSTTSNYNTGIGYQALQNNTSNSATAVGYQALQNYTGIRGTAVGYEALKLTTTGSSNTAVGYAALTRNTTGGNNTSVGSETMANISTGSNNSGFGKYALLFSTTAFQNSAVGVSALHTNTSGASNTSMGFQSMGLNTTGNNNVALGFQAMYDNTTGSNNMALGSSANVGSSALTNASAIGYNAKVNASNSMVLGGTGADAVKVGIGTTVPAEELEVVGEVRTSSLAGTGTRVVQSDSNGTLTPLAAGTASQVLLGTGVWGSVPGITNDWSVTGNAGTVNGTNFIGTTDAQDLDIRTNNIIRTRISTKGQIEPLNTGNSVFIGENAGESDDATNNNNTYTGYFAGAANTTGSGITGVGYQALQNNTQNGATAVGSRALRNNTGIGMTAIGYESMQTNTSGWNNTAVGYRSMTANTTGNDNVALGTSSLAANTTGVSNTGLGSFSLTANTSGNANTGAGYGSLASNTTGSNNTAFGRSALNLNTTGLNNTAVGYNSLRVNTIGNYNTAMGDGSGFNVSTGSQNVLLGYLSANNMTTGSGNVSVGQQSLLTNITGSNNTAIGNSADVSSSALTNAIAIGYNAKVAASNSMVLGGTGGDAVKVGIGTTAPAKELEVVGEVRTSSLAGAGTRMVQADVDGTLTPLASGTATQVLLGTGVWGSVPTLTNYWSTTGNSGTVSGTNFIGTNDNQAIDFRTNNIITTRFTTKGQIETLNTGSSVFVGEEAGANDDLTNNFNVNIGYQAGKNNSTGTRNVSIGHQALTNNTSNNNVAIGSLSLTNSTTGTDNIALGTSSLTNNTTGGHNIAIGTNTLNGNSIGYRNIAIGSAALTSNTGNFNTAIGDKALLSTSTGNANTAIGAQAMFSNQTGSNNVAVGFSALINNLTGIQNTAIGFYAGQNATGTGNVFIGNRAGSNETGNGKLYIANTNATSPLIYGDFGAALLRVNGTLNINNTYSLPTTDGTAGQSLTTDGAGIVSWSNGASDNMGNHNATQNIQLNNNYLSNDGDNEGIVIDNNGNVGVGTPTPTQAKLVINGTENNTLSYGYLMSDGTVGTSSGTTGYSLYASGRIAATEFNAFSDERIKNIKGISNSAKDLETLNNIQITDYTFKDSIGKGLGTNKKVIAQQVKEVYPQAVSEITDVIPDIYTIAKIKDGRVILKNSLQKGDRVKLIFDDRTELVTVLQADEFGFNVSVKDEGKVFVFGREVKDFHTVDYEALSTLNISATQELIKIINQQEAQIRGLKADNADINKRLSQTEADINQIKNMFNSTISSNSK